MSKDDELLSIQEAGQRLGVSAKTVRRWIHSGRLPAHKQLGPYGEQYRVPIEAVQTAQQVLDVVKVERPTDPRVLALAVAQALEEREAALREELAALRQQIAALDIGRALAEQHTAVQEELTGLRHQVRALTEALHQRDQEQDGAVRQEVAELRALLAERLPAPAETRRERLIRERRDAERSDLIEPGPAPDRRPWWKFWERDRESQ